MNMTLFVATLQVIMCSSMEPHRAPPIPAELHRTPWYLSEPHGAPGIPTEPHGAPRNPTEPHGAARNPIGFAQSPTEPHGAPRSPISQPLRFTLNTFHTYSKTFKTHTERAPPRPHRLKMTINGYRTSPCGCARMYACQQQAKFAGTGEPRRAKESSGELMRSQESLGEVRRAQEGPAEPRRAQAIWEREATLLGFVAGIFCPGGWWG